MDAYCYLIVLERKLEREIRSFPYHTIYLDPTLMSFDDRFNVAKPQAKTLDVVKIARMGAVEFFEDASLRFLAHPDTIVFNADDKIFRRAMSDDADQQVLF